MRARLLGSSAMVNPPSYDLDPAHPKVQLGRSRDNTIVIDDKHASRWHAEISYDGYSWLIREVEATNGTYVDERRIDGPTVLTSGCVLRIGAARFRFVVHTAGHTTTEMPALVESPNATSDVDTTLQADELTALVGFMNDALSERVPLDLIHLALAVLHRQTGPTICGFLGLDPDEELPRIVLPTQANVDVGLSRRLTQMAAKADRAVWLGSGIGPRGDCDSLAAYQDAIAVPLRTSATDGAGGETREVAFGALHVYRSDRLFTEREIKFCEGLAGCLANTLLLLRKRRVLEADNQRLGRTRRAGKVGQEIVGESEAIRKVKDQIRAFGPAPCIVLILGESGAGKELVAEGLHYHSRRSGGPLVSVNCAAIPANLADGTLFGHSRGAFTDARADRTGYFQQADDGTLFLDEIGELSLENQARLLRVLETKCVRAVGAEQDVRVDVRIIAATNRDLEAEVEAGRFREDLYFRLGTAHIHVPPLRDRREDIPLLANHFLAQFNLEYRHRAVLSPAAIERLAAFRWPGNIRQLRSVIETAVAMKPEGSIEAAELSGMKDGQAPMAGQALDSLDLEKLEIGAIREALKRKDGNVTQAAELLGIHRDTLTKKIKKYGIE